MLKFFGPIKRFHFFTMFGTEGKITELRADSLSLLPKPIRALSK